MTPSIINKAIKMTDEQKKIITEFLSRNSVMCWSHCHSCSRSQGRFWVYFKFEFEEEAAIDCPCGFCGKNMVTYSDYDRDAMDGGKAESEFPDSEGLRKIAAVYKRRKDGEKTDENLQELYETIMNLETEKC